MMNNASESMMRDSASINPDASSPQNEERNTSSSTPVPWSPSGVWWRDLLHFTGPGWFVSIAYVDPGNYQADIQAGALSRYSLLCIIFWTSLLSLYVQILCVRLSFYGKLTLAEAQAKSSSSKMRIMNWFIAEFSIMITDLPEVIGIGIAGNIFFGWPYWVGVILSMGTTMLFLFTLNYSVRILEIIIAVFVGIMAMTLFAEMDMVNPNTKELVDGWLFGFRNFTENDMFAITGVVGAVVMPHNLYLHTAACKSQHIAPNHVKKAVFWSSIEPVLPILVSTTINFAVVAIAAERVYGQENARDVGLTDFCEYFAALTFGCALWATALLAAGQSSAITTTYTGQAVMEGFLNLDLPMKWRAIVTRLVAIAPCVFVSVLFPNDLNQMVNIVNASLAFLLPFAFTPLVKFTCDRRIMGENAIKGFEKCLLHFFALAVYLTNAIGLSVNGGGFFGEWRGNKNEFVTVVLFILEAGLQTFYAWWNWNCIVGNGTRIDYNYNSPDNVELPATNSNFSPSEENSSTTREAEII